MYVNIPPKGGRRKRKIPPILKPQLSYLFPSFHIFIAAAIIPMKNTAIAIPIIAITIFSSNTGTGFNPNKPSIKKTNRPIPVTNGVKIENSTNLLL
ncbi:hypothetical protein Saci_2222 [Sulfolobus acidocaldarius DSM 639]|uniref:Uncharacterized protein n=1 Tax=Sulfolobus acidocaldarius (strain ATCC 33909 / DSM 639 / JCM 8929 / NBRC 15157 / NCIMB 11770) TaxID=330779 RepID=Q4J6S3_SULAC|nr:hypothetical protein Saci_2222 [Sulfolobus acidocaldarius DSM 639]